MNMDVTPEERTTFFNFFQKLAAKFRKENALSDITWATCECCDEFKHLYIRFFFPEIDDIGNISLQREYSRGCSRPDFFFSYKKREYIIEVKKEDLNDHIAQYRADFQNARFGWISNYLVASSLPVDVEIRNWKDFHACLQHHLETNHLAQRASTMIKAYTHYLSNVCNIIKLEHMRLDNLTSLFFFNKLVSRVIEQPFDDFICTVNSAPKSMADDRSGKSFTLAPKNQLQKVAYGWFGICYDQIDTCICIGIDHRWVSEIYHGALSQSQEGNWYTTPYSDDGIVWFELKLEHFHRFNSEQTAERQEQLLQMYFSEVINYVKQFYK